MNDDFVSEAADQGRKPPFLGHNTRHRLAVLGN